MFWRSAIGRSHVPVPHSLTSHSRTLSIPQVSTLAATRRQCDSPPKLSGPHAPTLALMASGGCARVSGNLTRLSSSPTRTHHPKDLPHNRYITVITFDTHTLEIERKTFTKYTLHSELKFYMVERDVSITSPDSTRSA
jgi:hypothetical protein